MLSGNDTAAHYQQVLRTITYNNTAGGPGVGIEIVNFTATDPLGRTSNAGVASITINYPVYVQSIDRTTPSNPSTATSVTYTVTFNEPVTGVDSSDFALALSGSVATVSPIVVAGSGSVYTVTVNGITGSGTLGLNLVANGSIMDALSRSLVTDFRGQTYTIDHMAPFVEWMNLTTPTGPTTKPISVSYTVIFSEAVTGVDPTDFNLALNGVTAITPVAVSGSGSVYIVTVNGISGSGTLGLNLINDGSISDSATNLLIGGFAGEIYTIDLPPAIDLNGAATGTGFSSTYIGSEVAIEGSAASLTDPDSANLVSLIASLASPRIGDTLAANTAGTSITASFNGANLVLSGNDTLAHYQQVLRTITYNNTVGIPGVDSETVNFTVTDPVGLVSKLATAAITIAIQPLTITVGVHTLLPNTPNQQIPIFVQGPYNIHAYDLAMQIGDGTGSDGAPTMSYLGEPNDSTGNLFAGLSYLFQEQGSNNYNATFGALLTALNVNVSANRDGGGGAGLLGTLIIDTTGLTSGTWPLLAGGPNANNGDSDFFNDTGSETIGILLSITNGSITIDQPPAIDLNGAAVGTGFSTTWVGSAVPIESFTTTLTDPDSTNLASLTASLASPHAGDTLAANTVGTSITASFNGTNLVLSGDDTLEALTKPNWHGICAYPS